MGAPGRGWPSVATCFASTPAPNLDKFVHHHTYHNKSGDYDTISLNYTRKINVGGILIEYEGEDTSIGLLFASKAAVQIVINPFSGYVIDRIG